MIWFLAVAAAFPSGVAIAAVMSSTNYKIQSDSLNFGGVRSNSSSYAIEDTLGEIATGISSSTNYIMNAGYQQMQVTYIAITSAANVVMSPAIGGVSGGTATGNTSFTVTTDDPAGYTGTIQASTSPALVNNASSTVSFADYLPGGANPDFTFTNAATASSLGFSPKGTDISSRYLDNGSNACGTGSSQTVGACWDGLSTSPKTFLSRTSGNQPSGTLTTLNFQAASGSNHIQLSGTYTATSTVTVIPL